MADETTTNNPADPKPTSDRIMDAAKATAPFKSIQQGLTQIRGLAGKGIPLITLQNNKNYDDGTSKTFDVVGDYAWTLTPPVQRKNIPYIELREFEQDVATLYAQLAYWGENIKLTDNQLSETNPYKNLYHAKNTNRVFRFPYFEEYDHNISQQWEKTKGIAEFGAAEKLLNITAALAKIFQLAPGTTVNQPQVWSGVGAAEYVVNFTLFNTVSQKETIKNQRLKRRLEMSTLHSQRSAILASPPAIFEVNVPGIRFSPAAVIRQLTITNVGQMNLIDNEDIPDAYHFYISILELISESREILDANVTKSIDKIRAITEDVATNETNPNTTTVGPNINAAGQSVKTLGTNQ